MFRRAIRSAVALTVFVLYSAFTWMLSWLGQYICSVAIGGREFHPISLQASRLAAVTVVATAVVAVATMLVRGQDGCWAAGCIGGFFGGAIASGIGWLAVRIFPGTTVSTTLAQSLYGVGVLVWGILMWYIFLKGFNDELDRNQEED